MLKVDPSDFNMSVTNNCQKPSYLGLKDEDAQKMLLEAKTELGYITGLWRATSDTAPARSPR